MYAITGNEYRAISGAADLLAGETLAISVPDDLAGYLRVVEGRANRDMALRASDWTQAEDSPLAAAAKQSWADYRQALRDLPQAPGCPNVEWPTPPSLDGAANGDTPIQI